MHSKLCVGLFTFFLIYFTAPSAYALDDTAIYSDFLIETRNLSLDKQLKANQNYLEEHPNSLYKEDILTNIKALEALTPQAENPQGDKKSKDTELFFKAQGLAKTLSLSQKIALWEQFIAENVHSIYLEDAKYNLKKLQQRQRARSPQNVHNQESIAQEIPVAKHLAYKDPKKAMTLASTAGLVVPGMGHWYTQDYIPAGIFTALRVTGIGFFVKGYYDNSRPTQVTGFLIGLFSYVADVADAPFSVERFNNRLDQQTNNQASFDVPSSSLKTDFVLSFKF